MPSNIIVNNLTTQHKVSTGFTMAFPDVCKTPAPPAPSPVPIPYPNMGQTLMAAKAVSKRVKNNGQKVMVKGAKYTLTNGDNAGIAGGVISNKFMGTAAIKNQSFTTKYEKKGVGRLTDPHGVNGGSSENSFAPAEGQAPWPFMGVELQRKACAALVKTDEDGNIRSPVQEDKFKKTVEDHGIPEGDARAIQGATQHTGQSITMRSGNKDCNDKMKMGFEGKPMSCGGDSISEAALNLDGGKLPPECKGLVGKATKDGDGNKTGWIGIYCDPKKYPGVIETKGDKSNATGLMTLEELNKGLAGKKTEKERLEWLHEKGAYTGDYDSHDIFTNNGKRTTTSKYGEEGYKTINEEINKRLPANYKDKDGNPMTIGGERRPLSQHGPQNNFGLYCLEEPCKAVGKRMEWGDEKFKRVLRPDPFNDKEHRPLLHFDSNGKVYIIESKQDLYNLYKCKGAPWPNHWPTPAQSEIEKNPKTRDRYQDPTLDNIMDKAKENECDSFNKFNTETWENAKTGAKLPYPKP